MGRDGRIVSEYVGYWLLRPRWGGAPAEMLLVTGAPARGGGTALRVDAQVVWLLERPASERIPGGVRTILFQARGDGEASGGSVFNRGRIRRVTALIDGLPAAQPGAFSCPGSPGRSMNLVFLDGVRHRLARAYVDGGGCEIVNLWIRGRRRHALQGNPNLIKQLSAALGLSLG